MAQNEDFLTTDTTTGEAGSTYGSPETGSGRVSSTQIRSEIERTRADLDETFAALDAKLTPSQIGLELWHMAKGGGTAGASKLLRIAREHPLQTAVIGLGLGWLLVERSRRHDRGYDGRYGYNQAYAGAGYNDYGYDYDDESSGGRLPGLKNTVKGAASSAKDALSGAREKVGDAAGWTKEHASDLTHKARETASDLSHRARETASDLRYRAKGQAVRARAGFWETLEENPLMVGAATLAVGVIAGLAIPSTRREDELMGETRDHLFEEVKEAGREAVDKTKQVADTVVERVKEVADEQGLTPGGLADKVKTVAAEAKNVVKEEAKNLKPETARQEEHEPELVRR